MERRSHPRIEVTRPVLYSPDIYPDQGLVRPLDLGMGGTKIETPYLLIEGERLEISIVINSKVIKSRGHVVHTELPVGKWLKAGIQLQEISKEDGLYLGEYISSIIGQKGQTSPS